MERLVKYLTEIKKIISGICDDPNKIKFEQHEKNIFAEYRDVIIVKSQISGLRYLREHKLKKYGYFLIDREDKDMLFKSKFIIQFHSDAKCEIYFDVKTFVSDYMHMYTSYRHLLSRKYPFKNKKSKYYIVKNYNPFDLRKQNLKESISRKSHTNKTGIIGVCYDKTSNTWCATCRINGENLKKSFAINKYGDKNAKELAIKMRKKWDDFRENYQ